MEGIAQGLQGVASLLCAGGQAEKDNARCWVDVVERGVLAAQTAAAADQESGRVRIGCRGSGDGVPEAGQKRGGGVHDAPPSRDLGQQGPCRTLGAPPVWVSGRASGARDSVLLRDTPVRIGGGEFAVGKGSHSGRFRRLVVIRELA